MNDLRPVNLNLFALKFPIMAIASIMHRLSGILLFFFIPLLLYFLELSLVSAQGFEKAASCFAHPAVKVVAWLCIVALLYHLFAGIRHMLMDVGVGETLRGGRIGAWAVMVATALVSILMGVWLW